MNNTCPHFSLCSGCQLGKEIFHPPIWNEALNFFQSVAPHLKPSLITDGFDQTRFKAKLAVRSKGSSGFEIGLFKKGTHEVLSIPECKVHHPAINRAISIIQEELIHHNITPYRENPPSGLLRYLQLFADKETGRIQLVLIVNSIQSNQALDHFCQDLLKHDLWHSVWLNFHPALSNRVLGDEWKLVHGEPFLWQTLNQTPIAFHPGAFSQSHLPLFEKMLQQIDTWIEPQKKICELYAGVGAISLSLRHKADHFTLVENNSFAQLSFQETAKRLNVSHFNYQCADVKDVEQGLIIVDPPRKGLDEIVLNKLSKLENSQLLYVSCGFESFKRDCESLIEAGWRFEKVEGYLLFPGTNHVEIMALLKNCSLN